jgi:hypothetical protein
VLVRVFSGRSRRCGSEPSSSAFDEGQSVGVNDLGVRRARSVRELRIHFQRARLEELCRKRRGIGNGDDLIVVAVHHQLRHVDDFQVSGEVRFREGLDAVVLRLGHSREK